eukprot:g74504.t1
MMTKTASKLEDPPPYQEDDDQEDKEYHQEEEQSWDLQTWLQQQQLDEDLYFSEFQRKGLNTQRDLLDLPDAVLSEMFKNVGVKKKIKTAIDELRSTLPPLSPPSKLVAVNALSRLDRSSSLYGEGKHAERDPVTDTLKEDLSTPLPTTRVPPHSPSRPASPPFSSQAASSRTAWRHICSPLSPLIKGSNHKEIALLDDDRKPLAVQDDGLNLPFPKDRPFVNTLKLEHIEDPQWKLWKFYLNKFDTKFILELRLHFAADLSEQFELHRWPFDRQALTCVVNSRVAGRVSHPALHGVWLNDSVAGWNLRKPRAFITKALSVSSEREKMHLVVFVERQPQAYVSDIVFPLFLIVSASFSVFILEPGDLNDRMSIMLTSMLTVVAFKLTLAGELPTMTYFTLFDRYVLACYANLLLVSLESMVVAFDEDGTLDLRWLDFVTGVLLASSWCLFHLFIFVGSRRGWFYLTEEQVYKWQGFDKERKKNICKNPSKSWKAKPDDSVEEKDMPEGDKPRKRNSTVREPRLSDESRYLSPDESFDPFDPQDMDLSSRVDEHFTRRADELLRPSLKHAKYGM